MAGAGDRRVPRLTIITVVADDWPGLHRTLRSIQRHLSAEIELWVIDGSRTSDVRTGLSDNPHLQANVVSEPDDGLFDAMNKGLDRARGEYALFINAGDELHEEFTLDVLDAQPAGSLAPVIIGYTVEFWKDDQYLRPGLGHERDVLSMPPHPATFYPRAFYRTHRYDLSHVIGSDGEFTSRAVAANGAVFSPHLISRFELGGQSSRYGDLPVLRSRFREASQPATYAKILTKAVLWRLVPRSLFYRSLARGKYSRVIDPSGLQLHKGVLALRHADQGPASIPRSRRPDDATSRL